MRIALLRLSRTRSYLSLQHPAQSCLPRSHPTQCASASRLAVLLSSRCASTQISSARQARRGDVLQHGSPAPYQDSGRHHDTIKMSYGEEQRGESLLDGEIAAVMNLPKHQRQNPTPWVKLLETYVPHEMREVKEQGRHEDHMVREFFSNEVLRVLQVARRADNVGSDVLAHMISTSSRKGALWVCDQLLSHLSTRFRSRSLDQLPSNIQWGNKSLEAVTSRWVNVSKLSYVSSESCDDWDIPTADPRYSFTLSKVKDSVMDQMWLTLGSVVINSTNLNQADAQSTMNAVHLILARIHNLDLIPEKVYDYHVSSYSSTIQRSPIVHLVSSRILTALSDASWRSHQDDIIEKVASHGVSYKDIGRDPPGGRFRMRVSTMGPEIWLEFILWCCVEGGFANTGGQLIELLRKDTKDPWFAITWSTNRGTTYTSPQVDWDRVRSRSGGTVGRIEGYSRDKPFAEVPPRTISTEAVLALVEAHVDIIARVKDGRGLHLGAAQNRIVNMVAFLEPHDLPVAYFDYLAARVMMTDAFDTDRPQRLINRWLDRVSFMKSLKPVLGSPLPRISFDVKDLAAHSEFFAGLTHQTLEAYVSEKNIYAALRIFDNLQKLVDNSKLHAISAFLRDPTSLHQGSIGSEQNKASLDFVDSHGQLPIYQLAAMLNLATDMGLVGFGQWLLSNPDPDGPLIPRTAYRNSSVARSLVRFAGMSNDEALLRAVVNSQLKTGRLMSVNFLRSSFDACVSLLEFKDAAAVMQQLTKAQAGGFGLGNLAHLAGMILKLENDAVAKLLPEEKDAKLYEATYLLNSMLAGHYPGRSGVYQSQVRLTFRRQVSHLLTIFQTFSNSSIAKLATTYRDNYPAGNVPDLSPAIFNAFLESVVQLKSASDCKEFVEMCCTDRSDLQTRMQPLLPGDHILDDNDEDDDKKERHTWNESKQQTYRAQNRLESGDESFFIPFTSDLPMEKKAQNLSGVVEDDTLEKLTMAEGLGPLPAPSSPEGDMSPQAEFASPFFAVPQTTSSSAENIDQVSQADAKDTINPVCVSDVRTVQLVVRKALREKRTKEMRREATWKESEVLKWARHKFVSWGVNRDIIDSEIEKPLADADVSVPEIRRQIGHSRAPYRRDGTGFLDRRQRTSRVSQSFGGKSSTRSDGR